MRTAGKFLIFSAVFLRAVVVLSDAPNFPRVIVVLAGYGLLLLAGTWLVHQKSPWFVSSPGARLAYLFLQALLVLGLLLMTSYEDFFAELLIPPSLDAVSFFGTKSGFRLIAVFSLAMTGVLLFSPEGPLFGLAMGLLYSGLCFVFGGYAGQVQKAETARARNRQAYRELQEAHRQLQGYADRLASLAVEHERSHLARDLHDSVTQTVFSMNLAAQSARLLWEKEPARVPGQLDRLEELAASAQREIQSLVSQLSPPSVMELGLADALRKLALEQRSRNGLQITCEVRGAGQPSGEVSAGLYSIAQEALTNVARHSGCQQAALRLHLGQGESWLEVEDHGRGFDPQPLAATGGHFGLSGMAERAHEMGWQLSIQSHPGQGTCIRVAEMPGGGQA